MAQVIPPRGIVEYKSSQSAHEELPRLPLRMIVAGPSGSGKTILIASLLTDLYRRPDGKSVFSRIFVFSPSVHVDPAWRPVERFIRDTLKVDTDEEWAFDSYNPGALEKIITEQQRITAIAKDRGYKKLFNICIVIDDFADDPRFSRHEKLLHSCFTRGRHWFCSTIVGTQKFRALSTIIRVNATSLCIFRLRSEAELTAIVEEISAILPKKQIIELLREATAEPYSFMYVNLTARTPQDMFWLRFERPLL
jgi:GTPase SAR1 family protein